MRVWRSSPLPSAIGSPRFSSVARYLPPRRRPGGPAVAPERVLRHVQLPAPVGVHDVDLVVAVAVGHEGDLLPVGRPTSAVAALRQHALSAPVGVYHID